MTLIENVPMPPQSAESLEKISMLFLVNHIPEHLQQPSVMNPQSLIRAIYLSNSYKLSLVDSFPFKNTEAQVNFVTNRLEITPAFNDKLEALDSRSLFTLAHETGHIILHAKYISGVLQTAARVFTFQDPKQIKTYENSEWQAEHTSGALLMPALTLLPIIDDCSSRGFGDEAIIQVIMDLYGTSYSAASSRLKNIRKDNLRLFCKKLKERYV